MRGAGRQGQRCLTGQVLHLKDGSGGIVPVNYVFFWFPI